MALTNGGSSSRLACADTLVAMVAVICGAAGALSGEHPTGLIWWNPILVAIFTFVVCVCGSRSSWVLVALVGVVATAATGLLGPSVWTFVALVGTVSAIASEFSDEDAGSLMLSVAGGLSCLALYRIPPFGAFGVPSLVATGALIPLVISGWWAVRRTYPSKTMWFVAAGVVVATGLSVGAAAAYAVRVPFQARNALTAAEDGHLVQAGASLGMAAEITGRASLALNGPWAWPARMVPIVSQHMVIAGTGVRSASTMTSVASKMLTSAGSGSLQSADGSVNLDALAAISPEVRRAAEAANQLEAGMASDATNWLLPQFHAEVDNARPAIAEAARAAGVAESAFELLPTLLGADGPIRYFVIFGTPAESRELGGLLGAYAVVEFDSGKMSLLEAGTNNQLIDHVRGNKKTLADPDRYSVWYQKVNVAKFAQNLTSSPMLQEVAMATRELVPPIAGGDIDAVVYVDPFAVEALVGMLGPIEVPGISESLSGANTAEYLLVEQYKLFDDNNGRKEFLVALLEGMFVEIHSTDLVKLAPKLPDLQPMIDQKRIQIATFDDELNQRLQELHLLQKYPNPALGIDFLAVRSHNIGPNKLDTWLHRDVAYDLTLDPETGRATGTVTIKLANDAPDGLPAYMLSTDYSIGAEVARNPDIARNPAANRTIISIYTPHQLVSSQSPTNSETEFVSWNEFGYERHTASLEVQPGETSTVIFELSGSIDPGDYQLYMASQPLVNDDTVQLTVHGTNGWKLGAGATSYDFVQTEDMQFLIGAIRD